MKMHRRNFLRGAVRASGAALLGRATGWPGVKLLPEGIGLPALPPPEESGVEHIVVAMMENRSFDHFLGWLPNADGQQAGLTYLVEAGVSHETQAVAPDFTGCGHADPATPMKVGAPVIASPFSRGDADDPKVKSMLFDHTSILKLIEWRFALPPLTARDASDDVQNLARALRFKHPRTEVPDLPNPAAPPPAPCTPASLEVRTAATPASDAGSDLSDSRNPWPGLCKSGLLAGWKLND